MLVSSKGELAVLIKKTNLFLPVGPGTLARVPIGGRDARGRSSKTSGRRTGLPTARISRSSVSCRTAKGKSSIPSGQSSPRQRSRRIKCYESLPTESSSRSSSERRRGIVTMSIVVAAPILSEGWERSQTFVVASRR